MPDIVKITNGGEVAYATNGLNMDQKMILFTNNATVTDTNVLGDFTEASHSGYAEQTLDSWPNPSTVSGKASTSHPDVTFNHTSLGSSVTIYGAVLYNPANDQVLTVIKYEVASVLSGTGTHVVSQSLTAESAS